MYSSGGAFSGSGFKPSRSEMRQPTRTRINNTQQDDARGMGHLGRLAETPVRASSIVREDVAGLRRDARGFVGNRKAVATAALLFADAQTRVVHAARRSRRKGTNHVLASCQAK